MSYTLWVEGYAATGEHGTAQCLGEWPGKTFREAVENWKTAEWSDNKWGSFTWNGDTPSVWGCIITDNEEQARSSFG